MTPGQGQDWGDIDIYESNGFKVQRAASLKLLFTMLEHKRFDYIPFCACEINSALSSISSDQNSLMIAENIVIYYPFPVYFVVNNTNQKLYSRISYGLNAAKTNGSMKKLFNKHFGDVIRKINHRKTRIIVIKTPNIEKYQKQSEHLLSKATQLK